MIHGEGETGMKKQRQHYELDHKRRIVQEYLAGVVSAQELARREGLERGKIYKWRVQLERRDRMSRIETIAETEGVSIEQARHIRELEEELAATQQRLAQTLLECDGNTYY
jgi:transposase-like protein